MRKREQINTAFDNFIVVSPKQIELAIYIRQFRRIHHLSQVEMAKLCSLYGENINTKITQKDIDRYEKYQNIPTPRKFQILMNTMDIDASML